MAPTPSYISTLSLHDALPIWPTRRRAAGYAIVAIVTAVVTALAVALLVNIFQRKQEARSPYLKLVRSEEHTSELQSPCNLVCRLLLEKKKKQIRALYTAYEQK